MKKLITKLNKSNQINSNKDRKWMKKMAKIKVKICKNNYKLYKKKPDNKKKKTIKKVKQSKKMINE